MWGICLGHQLLCRAVGLETFKLPFGHRGANHPVRDLHTGRVEITSQNHGFAALGPGGARTIDDDEPVRWDTDFGVAELTHVNLYDRTVEGLELLDVPGGAVQYHPEAGPGPHDSLYLFDRFLQRIGGAGRRSLLAGAMPRRDDIHKVLILGSGPIVIGQAAEFDYRGVQACKVLREEGYEVVLVNSNPATIMTDPELADATYIEPLRPVVGGAGDRARAPRRAARHARRADRAEPLEGAARRRHARALRGRADRRRLPRDRLRRGPRAVPRRDGRRRACGCPAARSPRASQAAREALPRVGLPCIVRPAFTLGGRGGGIARSEEEFERIVARGLEVSPIGQVLLDESVIGWGEFELEVMRDRADNVVIVCSIENVDPMGVHTGDSVTVAPQQTLSDHLYQRCATRRSR